MDIGNARREALRQYIQAHFRGNVTAFAKAVRKPQPQIADMIAKNPRKSFGEKVAQELIERIAAHRPSLPPLRFPVGSFTIDQPIRPLSTREDHGIYRVGSWPFAIERERFERLPDRVKGKIEGAVERIILDYEDQIAQTKKKSRKAS